MQSTMNKVINISLYGGIIGLFADSPHRALSKAVARENAAGWKVVQVVPAESGNIAYFVGQVLVLLITLLFFTFKPGYYVVFEKAGEVKAPSEPLDTTPRCTKCKRKVSADDLFCEGCGSKLK